MYKKLQSKYFNPSYSTILFLIVVWLIAFIWEAQYMPLLEDVQFCFDYAGNNLLVSLNDVMSAMVDQYLHWSGRLIPQFLVHCFASGIIPQWVFYISSAFMFTLLIHGLHRFINREDSIEEITPYIVTLLCLYLVPVIGRSFFGHISFVLNYLWASAIYSWFLLLLFNLTDSKTKKPWQCFWYCVFAFICGSFQESFSIPICVCIGFAFLKNKCQPPKGMQAWIIYSFIAGAIFCITAPGNFEKLFIMECSDQTVSYWNTILNRIQQISRHVFSIDILLAALGIWSLISISSVYRFFKYYWYLFVAIIVNILFAIFIAFNGEHQFVLSGLCSTILLSIIINRLLQYYNISTCKIIKPFLVILFIATIIPITYIRQECKESWDKFLNSCSTNTDGLPVATDVLQTINKHKGPYSNQFTNVYYMRWTLSTHAFPDYYYYLSNIITRLHDSTKIKAILPHSKEWIVQQCSDTITPLTDCGGYIIKVDSEIPLEDIYLTLYDDRKVKFGAFSQHAYFVDAGNRYIFLFRDPANYLIKDVSSKK